MGTISDSQPMGSRQFPTPHVVQLVRNRSQRRIPRSPTRWDSSTPPAACCHAHSRLSLEHGSPSKTTIQQLSLGPAAMPARFFLALRSKPPASLPYQSLISSCSSLLAAYSGSQPSVLPWCFAPNRQR